MVYMFIAVIILTLSLVPVALLLLLRTLYLSGASFTTFQWYGEITFCSILFIYFLFGTEKKMLALGQAMASKRLFEA